MSERDRFFFSLLRPAVIQILRASGFQAARPLALDTLVDITIRYLLFLVRQTQTHAYTNHNSSDVTVADVRMALADAGVFAGAPTASEEVWSERLRKRLADDDVNDREEKLKRRRRGGRQDGSDSNGKPTATTTTRTDENGDVAMPDADSKPAIEPVPTDGPQKSNDDPEPKQSPDAESLPDRDGLSFIDDDGEEEGEENEEEELEAARRRRHRLEQQLQRRLAEDTRDLTDFLDWITGDANREILRIAGRLRESRPNLDPVLGPGTIVEPVPPPPPPQPSSSAGVNSQPGPSGKIPSNGPASITTTTTKPDSAPATTDPTTKPPDTKEDPTVPVTVDTNDAAAVAAAADDEDEDGDGLADYVTQLKKKHFKTGGEARFQGTILGIPADSASVTIEGGFVSSLAEWGAYVRARNANKPVRPFGLSPASSSSPSPSADASVLASASAPASASVSASASPSLLSSVSASSVVDSTAATAVASPVIRLRLNAPRG